MKREIYIISDNVTFCDGFLEIKSTSNKLYVRIQHKASYKYLKKIKNDIFKNKKLYKLVFEGNSLIENKNSIELLASIEKANNDYSLSFQSTQKRNFQKSQINKNQILIDKESYIKFLSTLQIIGKPIITISENHNDKISDSILFQVKTKSNDILFIWESSSKSSKATYLFLSNEINYSSILNYIKSFLESSKIENKRKIILENINVQKLLSFVKIIKHESIEAYILKIKYELNNAEFNNSTYNQINKIKNIQDIDIISNTKFIDSFLVFKNRFYLVENEEINFKKEITIREYNGINHSKIQIPLNKLYQIKDNSDYVMKINEEKLDIIIPYEYEARVEYNDYLNKDTDILNYEYIGITFYEINNGLIKKDFVLKQKNFINLSY